MAELPKLNIPQRDKSQTVVPGAGNVTLPSANLLPTFESGMDEREVEIMSRAMDRVQFTGSGELQNLGFGDRESTPLSPDSYISNGSYRDSIDIDRTYTVNKQIGLGLASLPLAFADTVGKSVGLLDEDSVENSLKANGFYDYGNFYHQRKQIIGAAADLGGMFIPGMIAVKVLKGTQSLLRAGSLGETLKNSTAIARIMGSGVEYSKRMKAVEAATLQLGKSEAVYAGKNFANSLAEVVDITTDTVTTFGKLKSSTTFAALADGARKGLAFELGVYGTMNESDFLYPAEFTNVDTLGWASFGVISSAGVEFAAARYAVRQLLAQTAKGVNPAADVLNVSEGALNTIFRPNERGAGIAVHGVLRGSTDEVAQQTANNALRNHLNGDIANYNDILATQFRAAGKDTTPVLTSRYKVSDVQAKNLVDVASEHPTAFIGMTSLDAVPDMHPGAFYKEQESKIKSLEKKLSKLHPDEEGFAKTSKAIKAEIDYRKDIDFFVVEGTGEITPFSKRLPNWLDDHSLQSDIRVRKISDDEGRMWFPKPGTHARDIGVDHQFNVYVGKHPEFTTTVGGMKTVGWETATRADRMVAFAVANRVIKGWNPDTAKVIQLSKDENWFTLEATYELLRQRKEAVKFVKFTDDIPDIEALQFQILDKKYKEFVEKTATLNQLGPRAELDFGMEQIARSLNLPIEIAGQPHPVLETFQQFLIQGDKDLVNALENVATKDFLKARGLPFDDISSYAKFQKALGETVNIPELSPQGLVNFELSGKLFRQQDIRPVFVETRLSKDLPHSATGLVEMIQTQRLKILDGLGKAAQNKAPLMGAISEGLLGTETFAKSTKVENLRHGSATSGGIVTQQSRIMEQHEVTKALDVVTASSQDRVSAYLQALYSPHKETFAKLFSNAYSSDQFMVNQVEHAYRYGWDIGPREGAKYTLLQTERNQKLWAKLAEENNWAWKTMPEQDVFLPNMARGALKEYTPIEVSELAGQALDALSSLSIQAGKENNYLRRMLGRSEIKLRQFHLPTPDFHQKARAVLKNEMGETVNIFTGATQQEATGAANRAVAELAKSDPTRQFTVRTWEEVERYNRVFDSDPYGFVNYADQANQSGRAARGGLFRPEVAKGGETLKSLIEGVTKDYVDIGHRTLSLIYEPQLNYAKQAHLANLATLPGKKAPEPSIWEIYAAHIQGQQILKGDSWLGQVQNVVSDFYDEMSRALHNKHISILPRAKSGAGGPAPVTAVFYDRSKKEYEKLASELSFDPFGSTEKYLQDTYRYKTPQSARAGLTKANAITNALTYRMLDVGVTMQNLGGVATTWAPIVRAMQPLKGESTEQALSRIGAFGSRVSTKDFSFSSVKAMASAAHYVFSPEAQKMFKVATEAGHFTPEARAMHEAFSTPLEGMNAQRWEKFINGASWFADSSETLSRKLGFGLGYYMAKRVFRIENDKDAMMFAHRTMTEMVGDYRSINRPQMYQGVLGIPLGMFQTYMLNYYRRLYGYIERKDYRTLAVQYAMQHSLYGAQQVPGFDIYSEVFASNYDGTKNPTDTFRQTFGEDLGDVMFYGTLSNIPKIFGAKDGINFFTRSNVDFNEPITVATINKTPVFRAALQATQLGRGAVDMFISGGQYSNQQLLEIVSRYGVNRAVKSTADIIAGEKTDSYGQLVERDTRDTLGIVSRFLGGGKMTTQKLQETYWRQKQTEMSQLSVRERMNRSVRSKMRDNSLTVDDMRDMFGDYLKSGGSPQYFAAWMRSNLIAAKFTKFELKYKELLASQKMQEFVRLGSILQPEIVNGE